MSLFPSLTRKLIVFLSVNLKSFSVLWFSSAQVYIQLLNTTGWDLLDFWEMFTIISSCVSMQKQVTSIEKGSPVRVIGEPQNCWGWKVPWRSFSLLKTRLIKADCSGTCPVRFWESPKRDTPQPLWASGAGVWPPSQGAKKIPQTLCPDKPFHVSKWHSLFVSLLVSLGTTEKKELGSVFDPLEPSLFCAVQFQLSQPLLKWQVLQSLSHLCDLHHTYSTVSISLLHWGAQNWIYSSRSISAVLRREEGSHPLTSWQCSAWCSPGDYWLSLPQRNGSGSQWTWWTSRAFSAKQVSGQSAHTVCTGAWACFFPGAGLEFPFVELHKVPVGPFLQPVGSLWMTANPCGEPSRPANCVRAGIHSFVSQDYIFQTCNILMVLAYKRFLRDR